MHAKCLVLARNERAPVRAALSLTVSPNFRKGLRQISGAGVLTQEGSQIQLRSKRCVLVQSGESQQMPKRRLFLPASMGS